MNSESPVRTPGRGSPGGSITAATNDLLRRCRPTGLVSPHDPAYDRPEADIQYRDLFAAFPSDPAEGKAVVRAPTGEGTTPPVALVTGGAIRVGRALTLGLAEAGYEVCINYCSSESEALAASRAVSKLGRRAMVLPGDVSDLSDVTRMVEAVTEQFGRLDLLVNNASLFRTAPLLEIGEGEWDRVMAVNVKGPFLMVQATAELLTRSRGRVVNLVDLSAFQPWVEHAHHSVSKAALLQLTRIMARALAPRVRVNAVAPGAVLLPEGYDEDRRERSRRQAALGTLGSPEDVVRTVLFLERSPFITGEVIVVDGGRLMGG